jgi:hypothetical protein
MHVYTVFTLYSLSYALFPPASPPTGTCSTFLNKKNDIFLHREFLYGIILYIDNITQIGSSPLYFLLP